MRPTENELKQFALDLCTDKNVKLLMVALSGSHLYGTSSEDSDYDVRGVYIAPTQDFFKLKQPKDVITKFVEHKGYKIDIELMEIRKYLGLLLQNNCNVYEHIYAKNIHETSESKELRNLAKSNLSKKIFNSYNGMGDFNYRKFIDSGNPIYDKSVKKYLYVFRAYLAGTNALIEQNVISDINTLLDSIFLFSEERELLQKLIKYKRQGIKEIDKNEVKKYDDIVLRLKKTILICREESELPEEPENNQLVEDWLVKLRIKYL